MIDQFPHPHNQAHARFCTLIWRIVTSSYVQAQRPNVRTVWHKLWELPAGWTDLAVGHVATLSEVVCMACYDTKEAFCRDRCQHTWTQPSVLDMCIVCESLRSP
jgi:hypothetical protein